MPRPNKPINPGRLEEPVASSRGSTWAKHKGPEHAAQFEPDGAILIDAVTQETVAHIDLTVEPESASVVEVVPEVLDVQTPQKPAAPVRYRWESERSIEGRLYRRTDVKVPDTSV